MKNEKSGCGCKNEEIKDNKKCKCSSSLDLEQEAKTDCGCSKNTETKSDCGCYSKKVEKTDCDCKSEEQIVVKNCGCDSSKNKKKKEKKGGCGCSGSSVNLEQEVKSGCGCSGENVLEKKTANVKKLSKKAKLAWLFSVLGAVVLFITIPLIVNGTQGLYDAWQFVSSQILGMKWLDDMFNSIFGGIFGDAFLTTWYGKSVVFFFYDTIKILVLLCTLILLISYVQSYFPPKRTKEILSKFSGIKGNIMGALLGTLTPFCSCSSIPLFIGFQKAGIRKGITFSFLISSPLVDIGAFLVLTEQLSLGVAIAYLVIGLVLAVIGGTLIEKFTRKDKDDKQTEEIEHFDQSITNKQRWKYAAEQMHSTLKKVWPYVFIGVLIGASIHNVIPQQWTNAVLGMDNPFSVIIATLFGVPMYADIFGTIPIASALFAQGVGVGTLLAFMMSVTALSLPSMIMLSKVLNKKMLWIFISTVVVGIIVIGYLFNAFNFLFV